MIVLCSAPGLLIFEKTITFIEQKSVLFVCARTCIAVVRTGKNKYQCFMIIFLTTNLKEFNLLVVAESIKYFTFYGYSIQ